MDGFFDSNGTGLKLTGLIATPEDAVKGSANVKSDFPGLTAIRMDASASNPDDPNIAKAIQECTKAGIGANGADSAFATADGSKLTPDGVWLRKNTLA